MHRDLVERLRWIDERRFLHALNVCTLLPGPEAQQLSIYAGWRLHRTAGGIVAGVCFVLPGAILIGALSWVHAAHGHLPGIVAVFSGLKAAVVAIVVEALWRIGRRALRGSGDLLLAAAAFMALVFLLAPFPVVIGMAAMVGWVQGRARGLGVSRPAGRLAVSLGLADSPTPSGLHRVRSASANVRSALPRTQSLTNPGLSSLRRLAGTIALWLVIWWAPLLGIRLWFGDGHVLWREAVFFSQAACVTFGGAYAVLAYVNDAAVHTFGWLDAGAMLDGLGLAETTPGPLILVLEFVGFHGAWRHPGDLSPAVAGSLGALVTLWATFIPSFLWIFAAAPSLERLRAYRPLAGALAAVTAAVVGVIAALALQLARASWWPAGSPDVFALAVSLAAGGALLKWGWNMALVIALAAAAGGARHLLR